MLFTSLHRDVPTLTFDLVAMDNRAYLAWFMFFDIEKLGQDFKALYDAPDEAPISLKVLVYAGLYYMFSGHPLIVEHSPDTTDASGILYRTYAETSRLKLEECLASFPM